MNAVSDGLPQGEGDAMARSDPSALRWLIGNELRHYRQLARETVTSAAKALGCSHGKITHMETGRTAPHADELAGLLRFYRVDQYEIDRLTTLAGQSNAATWWAPWASVVPDWFRTFVGLEGLADTEFVYQPIVVSGLLQTEGYARAIISSSGFVRRDQSERFVSFRLARARRVTDPEPLRVHAVIGEAALRLQVGDSEIMRTQYEHLIDLTEQPQVTLQVLRPQNGPHDGISGSFLVLDFTHARSVAYVELLDGAVYVQDSDGVGAYTMTAENLQEVALPPHESVAFIKSLIDAL